MMHREVSTQFADRIAYPVIPAFVVAGSRDRVGGMLAAWWTQLSFKPLLFGVAIAPERYTYRLIIEAGRFSINLIDFKYVGQMPYIGDVSERFLKGKISKAGFKVMWCDEYNIPYIEEANAYMLLKLVDRSRYGDHDLFIGEVLKIYADETFEDGMWNLSKYKPIMYLGRSKKPKLVKRVYVTFKGVDKVELEFAGGELKRYSILRYDILNELREVYRRYRDPTSSEFMSKATEILKRYNLDKEDLKYYIEELQRSLG